MQSKKTDITAVIPAAGVGKRFGSNKPFVLLGGKPLFIHVLEILQSLDTVTEIIPVMKPEDMEQAQIIIEDAGINKVSRIAPGGKERQDSVYNGLKLIRNENCLVLVHDAVRPFASREIIENAINELGGYDGVIPAVPLKDTIKEADGTVVIRTLTRENLRAVQTPQIFPYRVIWPAYVSAMKGRHYSTDDSALVELYGGRIKIVAGSYNNIKITTPEDLVLAEALLRQMEVVCGQE